MCGRIAQVDATQDLAEKFEVQGSIDVAPSYNIAPGSRIISFRMNDGYKKVWDPFIWGIQPSWMKGKRSVINARIETVTQKLLFKDAFSERRNVIPVAAYYEWHSETKQPYCIRRKDGSPLLLAGLYTEDACVIMTRSAQRDIEWMHHRMPVILCKEDAFLYLSEAGISYEDDTPLDVYAVTRRVGNPIFDQPACFEPINNHV